LGRLVIGELYLAVEEVALGKVGVEFGEDGSVARLRGECFAFLEVRASGGHVAGEQVGLGECLQRDAGVVPVADLAALA